MRRGVGWLLVALVVLGTGCQAPSVDQPSQASSAGELDVRFDPPYNASVVLDRVERLRGLNATEQIVVYEYPRTPTAPIDLPDRYGGIRPTGALTLGLASSQTVRPTQPLGYTVRSGGVVEVHVMSRGGLSDFNTTQELVLAHELTHALQYQHGLVANNRAELREAFRNWTTDAQLAALAVIEGDAMVTTVEYRQEYAQGAPALPYPRPVPPRAAWQAAFATAPYQAGLQYFRTVGTDPTRRTAALRDPPNDTRSLLHPEAPPRDGSVPAPPQNVGVFRRVGTDTVGELGIRVALQVNGLGRSRATAAAKGWVDGRMDYYEQNGHTVVRWTTRWVNRTEAEAFSDAYTESFRQRNATWREDLLITPPTNTTPRTVLHIEQRGEVLVIVAANSTSVVSAFLEAGTDGPDSVAGVLGGPGHPVTTPPLVSRPRSCLVDFLWHPPSRIWA